MNLELYCLLLALVSLLVGSGCFIMGDFTGGESDSVQNRLDWP